MNTKFPRRQVRIWAADPLDKIFTTTEPPARPARSVTLDAARGEVVSGQIAMRISPDDSRRFNTSGFGVDRIAVESPKRDGGRGATLSVEPRWVGWTYVPQPANGIDAWNLDGAAPGLYPDPLYRAYETHTHPHHLNPDHSGSVFYDQTRAIWLTVRVPRNARPGVYHGAVVIKVAFFGDELRVPLTVRVHPATLPARPTCGVENWFAIASVVRQHEIEWFSDCFWELTEAYLRNLADHRQTHIVVPMYELIEFRPGRGDRPQLSWTRFDRFVELALRCGLSTLVGNHLATYTYDGPKYRCGVHTFRTVGKTVRYELHEGRAPEAQRWLSWFLPKLREHLRRRGWLGRWWQHVRDEPGGIREDYEAIRQAVKTHAPEFRTIDALDGPIVDGCDCWVPVLSAWKNNYEFFRERQAAGEAVWTYVCCAPTGPYANRFIDQKSLLPRLIFWIMARYGAQGYLHWGYNWPAAPVPEIDTTQFMPAQGPVQSGDVCVVYPGPHGPRDSIRWELQREGLQDYELLRLLQRRDPAKADRIAATLVKDFDRYELDTATFRRARKALLKALS